MSTPTILHTADSKAMGCGATVRFVDGDPCTISIARTGVIVKKSRIGWFGAVLYDEKNTYRNARTAMALAYLYPHRLFPDGVNDPILRCFFNAILHCSSIAEVSVQLNEAVSLAEKKLGRSLSDIARSDLPDWAKGHLAEGATLSEPIRPPDARKDLTSIGRLNEQKMTQETSQAAIKKLAALMEAYPSAILDATMLPLPKADMKSALKYAWLRTESAKWREWLELGYVLLADFQDGVGPTPIQPVDLPDLKPELLKDWLLSNAGRASMEAFKRWQQWQELVGKESDFLLAELKQWKTTQKYR